MIRSLLLQATAALLLTGCSRAAQQTFLTDPDYLIDTWETEDGLPENSATAMVQDADGYLWFGTFAGLVRFDGVRFTEVRTPLLDAGVVNLHLDRAGRLWVSTYRRLCVREGGRWRELTAADGWQSNYVRTFSERADGALLVTTFDNRILEFADGRFTELPLPPGTQGGYLGGVEDSGKWCVAQHGFAGTWDGTNWQPLVPAEELRHVASDGAGLAPARDGGLWVLLGRQLRKFRHGTEAVRIALPELPGGVWSLYEDSAGQVWIASYHAGLSRVSPDGTMRRWSTANGSHYALRFAFEDRERNVWIGTSGAGLQRFKPRRFHAYGLECGLTERNINSLAPAPGGMFIGSNGAGVFRLENGRATRLDLPGIVNVQSVLTDRSGRTWVGTSGQGLWVLENGTPRRIPEAQTAGGNVVAIFEDSRGHIWISGGKTVAVSAGGDFRDLADPLPAASESSAAAQRPLAGVTCFAEDAAGTILLGNSRGVFRVEGDGIIEVRADDQPITNVLALYSAPRPPGGGTLWISSSDRGLLRWRDGKLSRVPYEGPEAMGMIEDSAGFLWLLTSRGIVRIPQHETTAPVFFGLSDGLPGVEGATTRQPVCTRDAAGRLWFAMRKGVASIDPAQLRLHPVAPSVYFESVVYRTLRDGGEVETRLEAPFTPPLILPPDSRRIEFHFAAPGFSAPEKMQFAMQLSDAAALSAASTSWTETGSRRMIEFFERPPGDFTLRVRAANHDGVWNETGSSLAFTVRPHYWQTAWFRSGGVLLLLALGGGFMWWLLRFRHARMEEKLALQQQRGELAHLGRVASMSELSGSLAHELNQPLAAILSNAQAAQRFIEQDPPDLAEVREILSDIVCQDRRAGEVIRRMRGMLKKGDAVLEVLPLNALAEEVLGMIRSDLVSRNISIAAQLAPALPPVYGDRIQLQQVILNLLVNACDAMTDTPTGQRNLTVVTTAEEDRVVLTVRDQGHGFEADSAEKMFAPFFTTKTGGLGMGLAICRSILTAHGGKLTAQNHPGGGAVFRMELPPRTATIP